MAYAICDRDMRILTLCDVPLYGRKVSFLAIFHSEDDALETLFSIEKSGVLKIPHTVFQLPNVLVGEVK